MNAQDMALVLKIFRGAWPHMEIDEATPRVWLNACSTIESDVALSAAERLAATWDSTYRTPAPKDFLDHCRLVRREQRPALGAGGFRVGDEVIPNASARIGAIRVYWAEAGKGRPAHNHHQGDRNCPRCSTAGEFIREHGPELTTILKEGTNAYRE